MSTQHTPGPWLVDFYTDTGAFDVYVGNPLVTICRRGPWDHRKEVSEANARLITAAPELLGWAQRQIQRKHRGQVFLDYEDVIDLELIIAKATGATP